MELAELLALDVYHKGLLDFLGVLVQFGAVAQLVQFGLGAILGGLEHLGDGLGLLVGVLLGLEALGNEGQERCHYHHDDGGVNDGIYIIVCIHRAAELSG